MRDWCDFGTSLVAFLQQRSETLPDEFLVAFKRLSTPDTGPQVGPEGGVLIALTQGQFTLVDVADLPLLQPHKWFAAKSSVGRGGFYARAKISGRGVALHRFLMSQTDPKVIVDHKNRNTLDNRRENLREVDKCESSQNRGSWRTKSHGSLFKGVYGHKRRDGGPSTRWYSVIKKNGVLHKVGAFSCEIAAAKAYDLKALELHGEYAVLNFPEEKMDYAKENIE